MTKVCDPDPRRRPILEQVDAGDDRALVGGERLLPILAWIDPRPVLAQALGSTCRPVRSLSIAEAC